MKGNLENNNIKEINRGWILLWAGNPSKSMSNLVSRKVYNDINVEHSGKNDIEYKENIQAGAKINQDDLPDKKSIGKKDKNKRNLVELHEKQADYLLKQAENLEKRLKKEAIDIYDNGLLGDADFHNAAIFLGHSSQISFMIIRKNPVTLELRLAVSSTYYEWSIPNNDVLTFENVKVNIFESDNEEIECSQEVVVNFTSDAWFGKISFFSLGIAHGEVYLRDAIEDIFLIREIENVMKNVAQNIFKNISLI
ncbi:MULTISPECIES: hypothetical protein [Brevibacillus]|uniref:hypothetical protein n=1 Tax=Brevibacillus TaxID=55080 RepID=UPI000D102420|nr:MULTISPECIES: hypothetical protein [Brevibacillus]MED1947218.1 hypothetical protein [Brevibacillus formosus]MED1997515.1 hypothetical protein [Brevibacillus formosus]MED2083372.1 hypothetical protein [Brevibacillus formosus]PSK16810.1 hypothetical protein C7R94_15960 [Brevibacillus sp. NRRL NRS-603]